MLLRTTNATHLVPLHSVSDHGLAFLRRRPSASALARHVVRRGTRRDGGLCCCHTDAQMQAYRSFAWVTLHGWKRGTRGCVAYDRLARLVQLKDSRRSSEGGSV